LSRPSIPLAEPVVDVLAALLQVGAFQWIVDDIEQERVVRDLEVFPITDPCGALP
jgi:hypothetical protein